MYVADVTSRRLEGSVEDSQDQPGFQRKASPRWIRTKPPNDGDRVAQPEHDGSNTLDPIAVPFHGIYLPDRSRRRRGGRSAEEMVDCRFLEFSNTSTAQGPT
ncbi:hypothetical protein EVAR_47896_1 [Eumeta japonica]|uniref:Uncharacterized protein n=1 Tax=Eumeta variegata TaxID=151549 RepID=A0A4C1YA94_EUMVA|nr:hypothetical protein EVAR_47896_1 [Eumeta japonica]